MKDNNKVINDIKKRCAETILKTHKKQIVPEIVIEM